MHACMRAHIHMHAHTHAYEQMCTHVNSQPYNATHMHKEKLNIVSNHAKWEHLIKLNLLLCKPLGKFLFNCISVSSKAVSHVFYRRPHLHNKTKWRDKYSNKKSKFYVKKYITA